MPLFDSLEREVSSFFVAQGSIFDTILKTLLERLAHVETRVDATVHTINTLALSVKQIGQTNTSGGGDNTVTSGCGVSQNAELEYFVMTLARQLNVVLGLLFHPYAHDAVAQTHARQQQMPSISHVLTDNESILTAFASLPRVSVNEEKVAAEFLATRSDRQNALSREDDVEARLAIAAKVGDARGVNEFLPDELNPAESVEKDAHTTGNANGEVAPPTTGVLVLPPSEPRPERKHRDSTFTMIHQLQSAEDWRRHYEQELQQHMERRLHESHASCQTQCQALHNQNNALLLELQHQHEKLRTEWSYHQEKQASFDLVYAQLQDQQQNELDKQLLAFSNTFLASQTTQEQQISRILDHLREFGDRFVSKADVDQLSASWLQTARDDCVYGADVETLARFQHDLVDLHQTLENETPSPARSRLTEEVSNVLELVAQILEDDGAALHGASGSDMMQSLRHMVGQLEDLAHDALADATTPRHSLTFLTDITRRMELGTASLLEALERQQEGYQQALLQQQAELELLKLDMHTQKLSDEELRKQLLACPNQEDTMRLVNALNEQIQASTSDSASRMLDTVDDLRSMMAGLPTHDFLEELLHSKADRSEIDRLRLLLASQVPTGAAAPSLSKSPTRCLSCDQSLPFMQSRPNSAAARHPHDHSARPSSADSASPSRPTPAQGSSPTRKPHHQSMVALPPSHHSNAEVHEHQHDHDRNCFVSPFTRAMFLVSEHGIPSTQEILRDLAKTIESTKRRRQRMQDQRVSQLVALDEERTLLSFAALPSAPGRRTSAVVIGTPEDRKNKIPLRRPTLSDQIMYGPSITSGLMKPRKSTTSTGVKLAIGSARWENDESKTPRPKTAVVNERRVPGGDVIMRAPSTTVVIRPFSEMRARDDPSAKRNPRAK